MTDEKLMQSYLGGDPTAFKAIYERYRGKVHSYMSRRVKQPQVADELMQSVFLKFHQTRHQFTYDYPLLQWLFVISRSTFVDHYRKDHSSKDVPLDTELAESSEAGAAAENASIEFKVIESLSDEQQDIIRSRLIDEKSYLEIAQRLNRSENAVRQIFSRAMKKLKTRIMVEKEL